MHLLNRKKSINKAMRLFLIVVMRNFDTSSDISIEHRHKSTSLDISSEHRYKRHHYKVCQQHPGDDFHLTVYMCLRKYEVWY